MLPQDGEDPSVEFVDERVTTEEVQLDLAHDLNQVQFKLGYYFPVEGDGPPVVGLSLNDSPTVYFSVAEAVHMANYLLQTAYRAEALDFATHTHTALTHNDSEKRVKEFRSAFNALVTREYQRTDVPQ